LDCEVLTDALAN